MDMNDNTSNICEVEGNICKKKRRALCFHCSKNLCAIHLMEHVQLMDDKIRTDLNLLGDKLNELISRFDQIFISNNIISNPFIEIEKWRTDTHKNIDLIADRKCQEINDAIDKYRKAFVTKNNEQLKKINANKKIISDLVQDAEATDKQLTDLKLLINETENYLNSLNTHSINVIINRPILFVEIHTQFFDDRPKLMDITDDLRQFKIIYIRQNGVFRTYYVVTKKDGRISDLKNSFVQQYLLSEECNPPMENSMDIIDQHPKCSSLHAVEVYDHRIHLQLDNSSLLKNILDRDVIVFYEIPYSLDDKNNPWILMPCCFQRLSDKSQFGWPVYLKIPRKDCRGYHIRDALFETIGKFFRFDPSTEQHLYHASFNIAVNNTITTRTLNDSLQEDIDFIKKSVTLIVNVDNQIAINYEQNISKQLSL